MAESIVEVASATLIAVFEHAPLLRCSFCNKSQRDVMRMIAGPKVQICDECVDICLGILAEGDAQRFTEPSTILLCALCRVATPEESSVYVDDRGVLCAGCVAAIEAVLGERTARR